MTDVTGDGNPSLGVLVHRRWKASDCASLGDNNIYIYYVSLIIHYIYIYI